MDEAVPSISSGSVGSRFVTETEIDSAKARRDEQWKAAYARLGQEPPPRPVEDVYDGRSLAEKLAANKAAKQEEWEEKTKLANQFRALEEDEVLFLDSIRDEELRRELKRKQEDAEELEGFKQAVAARNTLPDKPSVSSSASTKPSSSIASKPLAPVTKKSVGAKAGLKGVVVKKRKPSTSASKESKGSKESIQTKDVNASESENNRGAEPSKKRRVESTQSK